MSEILEALFHRRAVKAFDSVEIPQALREQILDAARHAPSSFNMQPYRFFWVESSGRKASVAKLCLGQMPAETASALVVAVADIGSLAATSRAQSEWMRRNGFSDAKVRDYERTAKLGRILFMPGPFGIFGAFKWTIFRLVNLWKTTSCAPQKLGAVAFSARCNMLHPGLSQAVAAFPGLKTLLIAELYSPDRIFADQCILEFLLRTAYGIIADDNRRVRAIGIAR